LEWSAPPPRRFLRWLVSNVDRLTWPLTRRGTERVFGPGTQRWREMLMGRHGAVARSQALKAALLAIETTPPRDSGRRWWALEGFTSVDCCLQSERSLLFIEGKRTEKLSKATDWYPRRNQLLRNLEVAHVVASGRSFGVLVIAEADDVRATTEDAVEG